MSMSKKIYGVVALLVAVAAIISAVSIVSIGELNGNTVYLSQQDERAIQLIVMDRVTRKRQAAMLRIILNTDPAVIAEAMKEDYEPTSAEFAEAMATYKDSIPANASEEMKSRLGIFQGLWDPYAKATDKVVEMAQINSHARAIEAVFAIREFYSQIDRDIQGMTDSIKDDAPPEVLHHRLGLARARTELAFYRYNILGYINSESPEQTKDYGEGAKKYLEAAINHFKDAAKAPGEVGRKAAALAAALADKGVPSMNNILAIGEKDSNVEAFNYYRDNALPALEAMLEGTAKYIASAARNRAATKENTRKLGARANLATSLVAGIGIIIAVILAYVIISRITRQLNRVIDELGDASTQVAEAAGMISSSSSRLAEGATEQAASLEESSASLEEMASMTRKNADNANRTSSSTANTVKLIDEGTKAVGNMSTAMTEISDSAEQISHIIKTIEEISFQTNLLALNAAVEAARAGDAGKGFAVVADEVRNLAQRAAQAARDTSELIEGTVTRVKNGSEVATRLEADFKEIDKGAKDVGVLIGEITTATNEQAQGVDQISTAVAQMDKVTQANAANSEECASASEELSAQAEALQGMVNSLVALVTGKAGHSAAPPRRAAPKPAAAAKKPAPKRLAAPAKAAKHEDPIPMGGGDDFQDF